MENGTLAGCGSTGKIRLNLSKKDKMRKEIRLPASNIFIEEEKLRGNQMDRIEQLEQRVAVLEQEVATLKTGLAAKQGNRPAKMEAGQSTVPSATGTPDKRVEKTAPRPQNAETPVQIAETPVQKTPVQAKPEPVDWEYRLGRVWLPRIFIFVLLLGLIFAFTIVAIAGTELIRILLGFGVAAVLYFFGERQIKKQMEALGTVLLSGAVSVAILTTFAMHVLYGFVPPFIAFIVNLVWIGLGLFLSDRHRSEAMAILTACAGYLVPFLVEGREHAAHFVIWYETAFYALLLLFAVRKSYKALFYTASGLWHAAVFILYINLLINQVGAGISYSVVLGALIQHVLLCWVAFYKKGIGEATVPVLFSSFVLTTGWAYSTLEEVPGILLQASLQHALFNLYLLAAAVAYGWFAYYGWEKQNREQISVSISICTVSVVYFLYQILPDHVLNLVVYFIVATVAIYLGFHFKAVIQQVIGLLLYFFTTFQLFSAAWIRDVFSAETFVWLVVIGTMLLFYRMLAAASLKQEGLKNFMIAVNAFFHLVFLTQLAGAVAESWSVSLRMMLQSFVWMVYAAAGVALGVWKDNKKIRLAGMILLLITLCKLIFVDMHTVNLFIRTILFIALGTVGLLVSRLFYVKK
ncbi:DUF2339 domain-containing protein [Heyndrickxia coagulans]|uniref:DUF2339 domain-containing protein n=1 Tax=Heyndrickxia coagulans TaxID=1398 RepID=A0A150KIT5_HEYCO|nr:DUF2339 domain-containing protein [Heyndrickxia coagulans]KYC73678.1 hypothetical protein B4099_0884 [Heyndrickxia coagulans]